MEINSFNSFIKFVKCDNDLYQLELKLKRNHNELTHILEEIEREKQKVEELKKQMDEFQQKVRFFEIDSKTNRQRLDEVKVKIAETSNPKEYTAYQHEISELETLQEKCEDNLFQSWQSYDQAKEEYDKKNLQLESWLKSQEEIIEQKKQFNVNLEKETSDLRSSCDNLKNNVSSDLIENYYKMKESIFNPVVPIRGMYCGACSFEISRKDFYQIKKHELVQCKGCYRLLYEPQE